MLRANATFKKRDDKLDLIISQKLLDEEMVIYQNELQQNDL